MKTSSNSKPSHHQLPPRRVSSAVCVQIITDLVFEDSLTYEFYTRLTAGRPSPHHQQERVTQPATLKLAEIAADLILLQIAYACTMHMSLLSSALLGSTAVTPSSGDPNTTFLSAPRASLDVVLPILTVGEHYIRSQTDSSIEAFVTVGGFQCSDSTPCADGSCCNAQGMFTLQSVVRNTVANVSRSVWLS